MTLLHSVGQHLLYVTVLESFTVKVLLETHIVQRD